MQNADKHTNAKTLCKQILKIQKCILQTDIQNTNTKMHNADKSQNTNTHDSNAKMEAPKRGIELVGHTVVVEYVWNHQDE